jgi:hypothetical protein
MFDWSSLARIDIDERARAVLETIRVARRHAPAAILEATGVEFGAMLDGLLPGLLLCICIVAATTVIGGAAGAAIGALAMGFGAAPGAAFGATAGFEAGIAVLEGLGLAFLVTVIGASVAEAGRLAHRAVREAWNSVDEPGSRWFHVDHAGRTLAFAAAALVRGILQGIVAFLVAKGASAAASRVPELVTKLRASRLGDGFAAWVERNWASLIKNERLRQSEPSAGGGRSGGRGSTSKDETGRGKPPARAAPAAKPAKPAPKQESPAEPTEESPREKPNPTPAVSHAQTLNRMEDVAKSGDVSTPENGLYLWSGGGMEGAGGAAMRAAEANGGATLEMTPAGKDLSLLSNELGPWDSLSAAEKEQAGGAWTTASERLAAASKGDVNVLVDPEKLRSNAIIFDELTKMQQNPSVTSVTVTDTSGNVLSSGSAADAFNTLKAIRP